jgi:hypothetical protein
MENFPFCITKEEFLKPDLEESVISTEKVWEGGKLKKF